MIHILQLIAMFTMLIDHVGLIFFHDEEIFRLIGRFAFPLYCWFLVQGYGHTRDPKRYMVRLLILALVSQIPYYLAFDYNDIMLNVIFTLLLSLAVLFGLDHVRKESSRLLILLAACLISLIFPIDYSIYGLMLVLIYRYSEGYRMVLFHGLLNMIFLISYDWVIQFYSLLASILILYRDQLPSLGIHRWIYRSFYPAHLLVLSVFRML